MGTCILPEEALISMRNIFKNLDEDDQKIIEKEKFIEDLK